MALCGLYPLIFPMRTLCFGPSRFFSQLHLPKRNKHQKDSNQAFENDQMGLKAAGMGSQPVLDHRCCACNHGAVLRTQARCSGSKCCAQDPSVCSGLRFCVQDPGRVLRSRTHQSHSSVIVGSGCIPIDRKEL